MKTYRKHSSLSSLMSIVGCTTLYGCLAVAMNLVLTGSGEAQHEVVYGRGPSNFIPQVFSPETVPFSVDAGVNCPTPRLYFNGFGAHGNDWANNEIPYASSNSGTGNYGASVGFSFPLGGKLSEFCKKYAAIRIEYERARIENLNISTQADLVKQCAYLYGQGIDFTKAVFDGDFAFLRPCRSLITALPPKPNGDGSKGLYKSPLEERKPPEPFSAPPTLTYPIR